MANRSDLDTRAGSMTKIRAEQIKSELELGTLAGDIEALTEQIGSIIGAEWKEEEASFSAVQLLDLAEHVDASHASDLQVLQNLVASGSVKIDGDAAASAGALYLVGASKEIAETEDVIFAGGKLSVVGVISGSAALEGASLAVDGSMVAGGDVQAVNADFSGTLDADGAAVLGSTLEVVGAAALNSTLSVTGSATLKSTLNVQGAADFDSTANFDGAVDMKAALMVTGSVAMASTLDVVGAVDLDSTLAVAGAVDLASTLDVVGAISGSAAIYGASLDVDGQVDAATGAFTGNVSMLDLTARTGSFSGDVTISGNLTISGTTTTVNTEEVTIADHNVIIDSNNTTGAVIDGAGFTFEGGTGDDLTLQWSGADQDMELKLGANFAKLHIGDLAAADAVLSGDLSAVDGAFSGAVVVTGDITGSNLSIVDVVASGDVSAVDGAFSGNVSAVNADFTGTLDAVGAATLGSTLAVTGIATFSAAITGSAGLAITGGISGSAGLRIHGQASVGELKIDGDQQQRLYVVDAAGKLKDEPGLLYNFVDLLTVSGSIKPAVDGAFKLGEPGKRFTEIWGAQANLGGVNGLQLDRSGDQQIRKSGAGDLIMSSSVAAGFIKFDDAYRGSQLLNSATAGLKLANSGEWATFASSYPTVDSILGAFNAIAAGGGAEKGYFVATGSVAAETAVDVSAGAGMADMSFAGLTKDNSMVFFNGQMLRSGSVAELASPASADYSFDGGAAAVKFAFAVEIGDQLVVQKL